MNARYSLLTDIQKPHYFFAKGRNPASYPAEPRPPITRLSAPGYKALSQTPPTATPYHATAR